MASFGSGPVAVQSSVRPNRAAPAILPQTTSSASSPHDTGGDSGLNRNVEIGIGEAINIELRRHASDTDSWEHAALVRDLHHWVNLFNSGLRLDVPTPAIRIERFRSRKLGHYRRRRNDFGLLHEIALNEQYLAVSFAERLVVLCHELLHEWQEVHGRPSTGNYHNREFVAKSESLGLITNHRGHFLGVEQGVFTDVLEREGVDPSPALRRVRDIAPVRVGLPAQPGFSKMKKFSCGCTNVRCAVDLQATCRKCGNEFQPAPPNW